MRERVGKEEGKVDIMRQMFWVAGARLHCALTGTIQKACWSFPPEQEAGVFFFSSVPHRLKVTWGLGAYSLSFTSRLFHHWKSFCAGLSWYICSEFIFVLFEKKTVNKQIFSKLWDTEWTQSCFVQIVP